MATEPTTPLPSAGTPSAGTHAVGISHQRRRPVLDIPAEIIRQIWRDGPVSRVDLARGLKVSPATTGDYTDRLIQAGVLKISEDGDSVYKGRGRKPLVFDLNPDCGTIIALDLEGPRLKVARLDFVLTIEEEAVFEVLPHISRDALHALVIKAVKSVFPEDGRALLGIGLSCPGEIDYGAGTFIAEPIFAHLGETDLCTVLRERFQVPVHLENDMCALTLGEEMVGLGRGADYFMCLSARADWVGAAVFLNGELAAGAQRGLRIGEWYLPVPGDRVPPDFREEKDGDAIRCRLERLATRGGLLAIANHNRARSKQAELATFEDLLTAINRRERQSLRAVEILAETLGRVLARIDDVLHFDRIVLNGLFLELGPQFIEELRHGFRRFQMVRDEDDAMGRIVPSSLLERAGLIGAGGLALKNWTPTTKQATEARDE